MKHHGYTHLALDVDELAPVHDRLVSIGATSVWDPRPSPEPGKATAATASGGSRHSQVRETTAPPAVEES